jgi:hypothetical protein
MRGIHATDGEEMPTELKMIACIKEILTEACDGFSLNNIHNRVTLYRLQERNAKVSSMYAYSQELRCHGAVTTVREFNCYSIACLPLSNSIKPILPSAPLPTILAASSSSASSLGSRTSTNWADPVPGTEVTACDYWIHMHAQYDRIDVSAQMALHTQLLSV